MNRKPARSRTVRKKSGGNKYLKPAIIAFVLLIILGTCYHYRTGLAYYLGFASDKTLKNEAAKKRLSDVRNVKVLSDHSLNSVGIDVSEYQGNIRWSLVDSIDGLYPIDFVFVRATAGNNYVDKRFAQNWNYVKANKIIRGAYHYYRPNENSLAQAENFIKTVKLSKGDLPPVLDIEQMPEEQSIDSLKVGLRRWLNKVEAHYGVKPIIYSGEKYYEDFLEEEFSEYYFWIANYNFFVENIKDDWLYWQFTERGTVEGIDGEVDMNIFNGNFAKLKASTIGD